MEIFKKTNALSTLKNYFIFIFSLLPNSPHKIIQKQITTTISGLRSTYLGLSKITSWVVKMHKMYLLSAGQGTLKMSSLGGKS